MTPLDIVPWKDMRGYDMGYPIKYTTPFRPVLEIDLEKDNYYSLYIIDIIYI